MLVPIHVQDDPPRLAELQSLQMPNGDTVHIIKSLAPYWTNFCIALNFDDVGTQLEVIRSQHRMDAVACCTAMFQSWLRGEGRRGVVSWRTLLEVMEEQREIRLRTQVVKALQTH